MKSLCRGLEDIGTEVRGENSLESITFLVTQVVGFNNAWNKNEIISNLEHLV